MTGRKWPIGQFNSTVAKRVDHTLGRVGLPPSRRNVGMGFTELTIFGTRDTYNQAMKIVDTILGDEKRRREATMAHKNPLPETLEAAKAELHLVDTRIAKHQSKLPKLFDQRRVLASRVRELELPEEPGLSVITFAKQFATSPRVYTYAAIRIEATRRWSITGQNTGTFSWRELVEFIRDDNMLQFRFTEMESSQLPF